MGWRPAFVLKVAQWRGAKGRGEGGLVGASAWRREKEERGGPGAVVNTEVRAAMALDRRAWAAPLPCEQGRAAAVGNEVTRGNMADGQDWGKAGLNGSGQGAREKERE
jgi:hypothetical protein